MTQEQRQQIEAAEQEELVNYLRALLITNPRALNQVKQKFRLQGVSKSYVISFIQILRTEEGPLMNALTMQRRMAPQRP